MENDNIIIRSNTNTGIVLKGDWIKPIFTNSTNEKEIMPD